MSLPHVSDIKNTVPNSLLTTYGNKSVELNVMKDITDMYESNLLEKDKILNEEKQKLTELNDQVWSLKDSYCNQMWQFSREHDFSVIFEHYPFTSEIDCRKQRNNHFHNDTERSSELMDLINEIDAIKAEILNLKCKKNLKQDVESALIKLNKLQSISDEIIELLKLISSPEHPSDAIVSISMPVYDEIILNLNDKITQRKNDSNCENLNNKKAHNNEKKPSLRNKSRLRDNRSNTTANKKEITTTPKNYPQLSLKRTIIFSAKTKMTNVSIESNNIEKCKSFTPKKRSDISIRFEQNRGNYNN